jgi:FKBP-type peptidyl-prolyl cis-trans isomerase
MSGDLRKISELLLCASFAILISCNNNSPNASSEKKPGKNEMEAMNRYLLKKDRERIQNYIERKNLQMKESPSGLWYQINREGEGNLLSDNSRVVMDYDCSLLDGTECYTSEKNGPKEFVLGKTAIEPGLNEGLRMIRPGGDAIFILPPYLGWGLRGDGKMIPPRSVIVYKVKIRRSE